MSIVVPFTVDDPTDLPVLPADFETDLFQNPVVTSWYTGDAAYITSTTNVGVARATTILDRTIHGKHLTAAFNQSFIWNPGTNFDPDINDHTFLRSDDTVKGYVSPISPWPAGDHFKVFFFKADTPASNRYLQGSSNSVLLSTADRVIANVGASQQILTRDPAKWNLVIVTWDASSGSVGLLVNSRGFTSSAPSANVAGTSAPIFGANTGIATGAVCSYRHIATGSVDLRKSENAPLFATILEYFETLENVSLGV